MNNKNFITLDEARVMSKLAQNIIYCQKKTKIENYQILVINGWPIEYRVFCSIMISKLSGDIPGRLRLLIDDQVKPFWKDIGFVPEEGSVSIFNGAISQKIVDAIHLVNGVNDDIFGSTDYLTLMTTVSQLLHEEKQLRLSDVNNNSLIT